MITEIGIIAGEIWHYLDSHGTVPFAQVVQGIGCAREPALMSLGWLAREGHVVVAVQGSDFQVSLRRG